ACGAECTEHMSDAGNEEIRRSAVLRFEVPNESRMLLCNNVTNRTPKIADRNIYTKNPNEFSQSHLKSLQTLNMRKILVSTIN
ncbi:hypothetical protein, partial [Metasolibacillus meyeri]|uniref:hypothetical protein n=1 Tax=Metasolibacillus meyeri TaxID=1071052 RepID=UPI001EE6C3EE